MKMEHSANLETYLIRSNTHDSQHSSPSKPAVKKEEFSPAKTQATPQAVPISQAAAAPIQSTRATLVAKSTVQQNKDWKPLAVKNFPDLGATISEKIPSSRDSATFSRGFLHSTFGGTEWSPGVYYTPQSHGNCILPKRTYYLLTSGDTEPYLPLKPGAHGATLTAFFKPSSDDDDEAEHTDFPLFVNLFPHNKEQYFYFGTYSQLRWSDKLDYDRMVENVPDSVKRHWAEKLSDPNRPEWVTNALMQAFWPKPEGSVLLSHDGDMDDEATKTAVCEYIAEMREWKEAATKEVKELTKESILESFEKVRHISSSYPTSSPSFPFHISTLR